MKRTGPGPNDRLSMGTREGLDTDPTSLPCVNRAPILAAACLGVFVGFGSLFIYTFGIFLKPLSAAFGWSRTEVSSGFLAAVLAVAIASPFLGRLFDRYPARNIIIPCTVIYAAGFASLGFLTAHLWHFIVVLGVMGIVGNGTTQLAYARVVSAWFDRSRGRALAAVMAGSGIGSAVFPALAQFLIGAYGWRWAYGILGALVLIVGLPLTAKYLYEPPVPSRSRAEPAVHRGILRDVLSVPFIGIVSALLLFSLATNGLNTHWVSLLTDGGFAPARAAAIVSVAGFSTLVSKLVTGFLLDRFQANYVAAGLFAICAAGVAIVVYGHSQIMAFAAAVLVGVGMGAESDAVPYLLTRHFGLQRFGELYGYTWTVYAVAGGVGPLLAGAAFDATHSYQAALLLFCGMIVAAAGIFAVLPNYRRVLDSLSKT